MTAVGDAIQEKFESCNWSMKAPSGAANVIWTVCSFGAVIDLIGGRIGLHVHVAASSRFQLYTTASALNGIPSENLTPERSVIVTTVPPPENL